MVESSPNSLPEGLWHALSGAQSRQKYSRGKPLFEFGQPSRGIYVVEKGAVNLFLAGKAGPEKRFATVGPGTVLGLSEAVSGARHKLTALTCEPTEVCFVSRGTLLSFMRHNPALCMQLVHLLSEDLHLLYHRVQCGPDRASRPDACGEPPN